MNAVLCARPNLVTNSGSLGGFVGCEDCPPFGSSTCPLPLGIGTWLEGSGWGAGTTGLRVGGAAFCSWGEQIASS